MSKGCPCPRAGTALAEGADQGLSAHHHTVPPPGNPLRTRSLTLLPSGIPPSRGPAIAGSSPTGQQPQQRSCELSVGAVPNLPAGTGRQRWECC